MRNRRQIKSGAASNSEELGVVHLPGLNAHDHETFCGFHWSGNEYEPTDDPADCPGCLRAAEESEKVLRHWKRSRKRLPNVQTTKDEDHYWCPECGLWSYDQAFPQHHTPDHKAQGPK